MLGRNKGYILNYFVNRKQFICLYMYMSSLKGTSSYLCIQILVLEEYNLFSFAVGKNNIKHSSCPTDLVYYSDINTVRVKTLHSINLIYFSASVDCQILHIIIWVTIYSILLICSRQEQQQAHVSFSRSCLRL